MKKILIALTVFIVVCVAVILGGCNRQIADTVMTYNEAILQLPNSEVVSGKVQSWLDYEDGDQIQVKMDGVVYLVHSSDIVLIKK